MRDKGTHSCYEVTIVCNIHIQYYTSPGKIFVGRKNLEKNPEELLLADKSMLYLVVSLVSSGGNPEKNLIHQMPSWVRSDAGCRRLNC